jgi:hypothetical protein
MVSTRHWIKRETVVPDIIVSSDWQEKKNGELVLQLPISFRKSWLSRFALKSQIDIGGRVCRAMHLYLLE